MLDSIKNSYSILSIQDKIRLTFFTKNTYISFRTQKSEFNLQAVEKPVEKGQKSG